VGDLLGSRRRAGWVPNSVPQGRAGRLGSAGVEARLWLGIGFGLLQAGVAAAEPAAESGPVGPEATAPPAAAAAAPTHDGGAAAVPPSPLLGLERPDEPPPEPWIAGAQLGFDTGVAPRVGGRWLLFAERSRRHEPATRLAAVLQPSSGDVDAFLLRRHIYAVRVELCSPALGTASTEWRGCGALDAGFVTTTADRPGAERETSPWGAVAAHTRLRQWLQPRLALEVEVGGLFPLSTYSVVSGGVERFRDRAGLSAGFGLAMRFD
jgi:hypothetical protein